MTTKVAVMNGALAALGEPSIVADTDSGAAAKRLRSLYDGAVRWLFEQHPWNFAQTVKALAVSAPTNPDPANANAPIGWDYAFNKPAGVYRILRINRSGRLEDRSLPYDDAGGQILCDDEVIYIIYVDSKWLTLEGAWPEVFGRAAELELALRAAPPTTNNRGKGADISAMAIKAMRIAKTWDSQQKPQQSLPEGSWVSARRTYSTGSSENG